jgi:hypothetical protein
MSRPSELFWKIVPPPLLNVTLPFDLCFVYKDRYYRQIDSSFLPLQQLKYSHMLDKTKAWWKSDNKSETGSEYLLSVCSLILINNNFLSYWIPVSYIYYYIKLSDYKKENFHIKKN